MKRLSPKIGSLVYVEWVDSYGCSSRWQSMENPIEPEMMVCKSVGWIAAKNNSMLVVVPHMTEGGGIDKQGCGDMTIPTACIERIQVLLTPLSVRGLSKNRASKRLRGL